MLKPTSAFLKALILVVAVLSLKAHSTDHPKDLNDQVIRIGAAIPSNNRFFHAINDIYADAFTRLGHKYEVVSCVPTLCALWVKKGRIHLEALRTDHYGELYSKYLTRVDVPISHVSSMIVSKKISPVHAEDLEKGELKNVAAAYMVGYKIHKEMLSEAVGKDRIVPVTHVKNGFKLLEDDEVNFFMAVEASLSTNYTAKQLDAYNIEVLTNFQAKIYPFLGVQFTELKEPLEGALRDMEKEGVINKIYEKHNIIRRLNIPENI